jgi:hypothetical protein
MRACTLQVIKVRIWEGYNVTMSQQDILSTLQVLQALCVAKLVPCALQGLYFVSHKGTFSGGGEGYYFTVLKNGSPKTENF